MFPSFNARALGLDLPADRAIDLAAEAGFAGIDLMVRDLVDAGDDPHALRRRMDDRGLRPGAWPLPIRWRETSESAFAEALGDLPRYAEAAAVLGLTRTGTWVLPEVIPTPDGSEAKALEAAFGFHVRRLAAIRDVLGRSGIRLGLETIGVPSMRTGLGPPFLTRSDDPRLGRLIAALDASGNPVGLLIDAWHAYASGDPLDSVFRRPIDRVVWVHVADLPPGAPADPARMIDGHRGLPGRHGAIDVRSILTRLAQSGYDGPVTAEPLGGCPELADVGPAGLARLARQALQSVWPEDRPESRALSG